MWFNKNKLRVRHVTFESKIQKYKFLIKKFDESNIKTCCWLYTFESTRQEIQQLCLATNTTCHAPSNEALLKEGINLIEIRDSDICNKTTCDEILFIETHPLRSSYQHLLDDFKSMGLKEVIMYTSMDEPVMSLFGGDRLRNILGRLGLEPAEPIEHSMISRSIEKAQQRIAEKLEVHRDIRSSPEDWKNANPMEA